MVDVDALPAELTFRRLEGDRWAQRMRFSLGGAPLNMANTTVRFLAAVTLADGKVVLADVAAAVSATGTETIVDWVVPGAAMLEGSWPFALKVLPNATPTDTWTLARGMVYVEPRAGTP